jgi:glycosyltransferase 2 family protein
VNILKAFAKTVLRHMKWFVPASLAALVYIFIDHEQFLHAIATVSGKSYFAAFALASVALFLNGFRWAYIVVSSGFPHSIATLVRIRLIGQGLNVFLPGGVIGDGLQVFFIARTPRLSGAKAFSSIVVDRLVAFFVILAVLGATLGNSFPYLSSSTIILAATTSLVTLIIALFSLLKLEIHIMKLKGFLRSIMIFGTRMAREISNATKKPAVIVKASILALAGHLSSVGILWLIVNEYAIVPFDIMVPLVSMIVFLTLIPFTFAGLGVREAALFAGLEGFGVSFEEAVAVSVVWLSVSLLSSAIYASISIYLSPDPETIGKAVRQIKKINSSIQG